MRCGIQLRNEYCFVSTRRTYVFSHVFTIRFPFFFFSFFPLFFYCLPLVSNRVHIIIYTCAHKSEMGGMALRAKENKKFSVVMQIVRDSARNYNIDDSTYIWLLLLLLDVIVCVNPEQKKNLREKKRRNEIENVQK